MNDQPHRRKYSLPLPELCSKSLHSPEINSPKGLQNIASTLKSSLHMSSPLKLMNWIRKPSLDAVHLPSIKRKSSTPSLNLPSTTSRPASFRKKYSFSGPTLVPNTPETRCVSPTMTNKSANSNLPSFDDMLYYGFDNQGSTQYTLQLSLTPEYART